MKIILDKCDSSTAECLHTENGDGRILVMKNVQECKKIVLVVLLTVLLGCFAIGKAATADSGTCRSNLRWTLDDQGVLTISGSGSTYSYCFEYRTDIVSVVVQNGVTNIGYGAFASCNNLTHLVYRQHW